MSSAGAVGLRAGKMKLIAHPPQRSYNPHMSQSRHDSSMGDHRSPPSRERTQLLPEVMHEVMDFERGLSAGTTRWSATGTLYSGSRPGHFAYVQVKIHVPPVKHLYSDVYYM